MVIEHNARSQKIGDIQRYTVDMSAAEKLNSEVIKGMTIVSTYLYFILDIYILN